MREVEAIGVLIGVDPPRLVVDEVGAGLLLLRRVLGARRVAAGRRMAVMGDGSAFTEG